MDARKTAIFPFLFVKPILQTMTHLIRNKVLENQFWSVKCTTVWYAKISSIPIPSHQAMQAITMGRLDEKKPPQNAFKCISHYIQLFKLYSISIIL